MLQESLPTERRLVVYDRAEPGTQRGIDFSDALSNMTPAEVKIRWTYIVGESVWAENIFKIIFCIFIALGCTINLTAVLDFSDAVIFVVALPNILGLYILAPVIKTELENYQKKLNSGEIKNFREI